MTKFKILFLYLLAGMGKNIKTNGQIVCVQAEIRIGHPPNISQKNQSLNKLTHSTQNLVS